MNVVHFEIHFRRNRSVKMLYSTEEWSDCVWISATHVSCARFSLTARLCLFIVKKMLTKLHLIDSFLGIIKIPARQKSNPLRRCMFQLFRSCTHFKMTNQFARLLLLSFLLLKGSHCVPVWCWLCCHRKSQVSNFPVVQRVKCMRLQFSAHLFKVVNVFGF